jgi:hypothetical protein
LIGILSTARKRVKEADTNAYWLDKVDNRQGSKSRQRLQRRNAHNHLGKQGIRSDDAQAHALNCGLCFQLAHATDENCARMKSSLRLGVLQAHSKNRVMPCDLMPKS